MSDRNHSRDNKDKGFSKFSKVPRDKHRSVHEYMEELDAKRPVKPVVNPSKEEVTKMLKEADRLLSGAPKLQIRLY